ncbi:hypothetical protein CoNPh32_CDS0023 [Staphylococcus phage S-CoN_Ph32]|nr:hypothetical protein CoNPh32_CDS0023 [Staphylococcus phage S-CoN_Ph32]
MKVIDNLVVGYMKGKQLTESKNNLKQFSIGLENLQHIKPIKNRLS